MTQFLVGTSGWQFPALKQRFGKSSGYQVLSECANVFQTVENNSAFYHVPQKPTLQKWFAATPEQFVFSMKLNRIITHDHKLLLNAERLELLQDLLGDAQILHHKLGAILVQTPPSLNYSLSVLQKFLDALETLTKSLAYRPDVAMEFRNESWFTEAAFALLRQRNVALVLNDSSRYPAHKTITADFTYVRLHGPEALFRSSYTEVQLDVWARFLSDQTALRRVYIYFNNTMSADVLVNAEYLQQQLLS